MPIYSCHKVNTYVSFERNWFCLLRNIKIICVLLCCVLIAALPLSVAAATDDEATASTSIYVKELDMSITLPNNMIAVTRQSNSNDPYFAMFESYDDTQSYFQSADCYLTAKTLDKRISLAVTMTKDENSIAIDDYGKLKSNELETIKQSYMQSGMYTESQTLKYSGVTFLEFLMNYKNGNTPVYGICCNTVVNGMIINLTFATAKGVPTAEENTLIHSIMGTVSFGNGPSFWDAEKIIIASVIGAVLIAIIVVLVIIIKRYKSPQKKHERIMNRLNEEYGINDNSYGDDEFIGLDDDEAKEELVPRDYQLEQVPDDDEEEEVTAQIEPEQDEYTEVTANEKEADSEVENAEQKETTAKRNTGVFTKLAYKPEHLLKEEDIFESGEDYFEEIYDDEIDGSETVDSFFEETDKKENRFEGLRSFFTSIKDGVVVVAAAVFGGVKYFFVHVGYLCINISRAIKRKIRKKRNKKRPQRRPQQRTNNRKG